MIFCASRKQKICTKDSTEAEWVSVSDYVPKMEWTKDFLAGQGEKIASTTLFQDNRSCIMVLKDPSLGKLRTRYIKARVGVSNEFLVIRGEAEIEYLQTDLMVADCMTKPLAGKSFHAFDDKIMNHISWEEMVKRLQPCDDGAGAVRQRNDGVVNCRVNGVNGHGNGPKTAIAGANWCATSKIAANRVCRCKGDDHGRVARKMGVRMVQNENFGSNSGYHSPREPEKDNQIAVETAEKRVNSGFGAQEGVSRAAKERMVKICAGLNNGPREAKNAKKTAPARLAHATRGSEKPGERLESKIEEVSREISTGNRAQQGTHLKSSFEQRQNEFLLRMRGGVENSGPVVQK